MRARLLVLCLAAGCGGDDSGLDGGDVDGFPYYIDFHVYQYADGRADLSACFYRYRRCEEAGSVEVEHGSQEVRLTRESAAGSTEYLGELDRTTLDEPIRFTWSGEGDQDRVTAEVGLAEPFTITAPADGGSLSSAEGLTIDWTADDSSGSLAAWGYRAECPGSLFDSFFNLVPDTGHLELAADDLPFVDGCVAEIWIERLQRGAGSSRLVDIVSSRARFVTVAFGP